MGQEEVESFADVFPRETEEEKDRFNLLDYAYIGARYDPKYRISKNDLKTLEKPVKYLMMFTESACKLQIENLAGDSNTGK